MPSAVRMVFWWVCGRVESVSSLPQMSLMRETNEERTNEMLGELKISVSQSSLQQQPELFQGIKG